MEEIFKIYRPHPLMIRMIAEIARTGDEWLMDDDTRSIFIDLIQQDMGTQGVIANRGQVGYWMTEVVKAQAE